LFLKGTRQQQLKKKLWEDMERTGTCHAAWANAFLPVGLHSLNPREMQRQLQAN
jgi:hypothetical protein